MARSYESPNHQPTDVARVVKMRDGHGRVVCTCGYRSVPMGPTLAESIRESHMSDAFNASGR